MQGAEVGIQADPLFQGSEVGVQVVPQSQSEEADRQANPSCRKGSKKSQKRRRRDHRKAQMDTVSAAEANGQADDSEDDWGLPGMVKLSMTDYEYYIVYDDLFSSDDDF